MKHIAWDYEHSTTKYYHIYSITDEGEKLLDGSITFDIPQTKENDDLVDDIVDRLDKLTEKA